jgi:hypothetical protein
MNEISLVFLVITSLFILFTAGVFSKVVLVGLLPALSFVFCLAPNLLVSIFGKYAFNPSTGEVQGNYPYAIQIVISLLVNVGYFGMMLFVLTRILSGARLKLTKPLILLVIVWTYASVIDLLKGTLHVANIGVLVIFSALTVLPKLTIQTLAKQTILVSQVIIVASSTVGLIFNEIAWISCRPDKCTFVNLLFRGIFPYANQVGLLIGLLAPIGIVIFKGNLVRVLYIAETIFFVYITGSRIALVAICFGYIAYLLQGLVNSRAIFVLSVLITFVGLLPFKSNSFLTGRSFLWDIAKSKIAEAPLGGGSYAWQSSGSNLYLNAASSYSSHNLILEILLTGGIPMLVIYLFLMRETYLAISGFKSKAVFPFMISFAVVAVGERPFALYFIDFSIPILISFILLLSSEDKDIPSEEQIAK